MHVLVSDIQAEHLPGCNLSARTACLKKIGGFDTDFRVAGDDVDVCWRLQQQNWTLGFSHGAVVWHRRRDTLAGYWKQQRGYGKAEALLERKWPEKYTSAGNLIWAGRLYGKGLPEMLPFIRHRIYYGVWGSGLFQRMYSPWHNRLVWLPQMPEWYLLIALLSVLAALGELWKSLLLALPLLAVCVSAVLVQAALGGARASFSRPPRSRLNRLQLRATVAFLHLLQPLARLTGRIRHGLTPWRRPHATDCLLPRRHSATIWTERWRAPEDWLRAIEAALRARRAPPRRGSAFDRWDLEVATGGLGGARLQLAVEEHGSGRQLWRYRIEPTYTARSVVAVCASTGLAIGAGFDHIWLVASGFGLAACLMVVLLLQSSAGAAWALRHGLREAAAQFERCSKTPTHEGHPSRLTQAAGVASPDSTPGAEP